jgi:hypothetical protein
VAPQLWHNKGTVLWTDYCGISGRSVDTKYVDARVELYSGRPLFIGNTQVEEWARDLGMEYPSQDSEILREQNAYLLEALTRWEQVFNVLGSVGITLSDDLSEYIGSIRPSLDAIKAKFTDSSDSDRNSAENDRSSTESSSESGPVHSERDGTDDEALRSDGSIKLGLG